MMTTKSEIPAECHHEIRRTYSGECYIGQGASHENDTTTEKKKEKPQAFLGYI